MPVGPEWTPCEREVVTALLDADGLETSALGAEVARRLGRAVETSSITVACRKLRARGLVRGTMEGTGKRRRMVWRLCIDD